MKKSLIALAVASVVSAPAFAATSNVDVYGIFGVAFDMVNLDDSTSDDKANRVSSTSSRIGFKGSEDLGGGLSGVWQIENGVDLDAGGNGWASRNTFLGLSSKELGTALLGKHDTAYKMATGKLDVFSDTIADYNTIVGSTSDTASSGFSVFDTRANDSVSYMSPSMSGLSLGLTYGARDETAFDAADTNLWSAAVSYANGPLFASLAYEKINDFGGTNLAKGTDRKGMKLGAGYTFGNTTIGGLYERLSETGTTVADRNAWYVSAKHAMGNIALKAAYGKAGDSDAGVTDDGAKYYAIGADYSLSKRTTAYALYTKLSNETAGTYDLGGSASTGGVINTTLGADPSAFSIGVKHSF
ncbi:MAG: porin [Thiobacillus sp.]